MDVWTGVACLVADPKCKDFRRFGDDGKGAYVNLVASVDSEAEFTERVKRIVPTLDCILLELDHVQPLDKRMEEPDYPEELITMRSRHRGSQQTFCSGLSTSGLRATSVDLQDARFINSTAPDYLLQPRDHFV